MLATAHGRGLAIDRPGNLRLVSAACVANGLAVAKASPVNVLLSSASAAGQVASVAQATPGDLRLSLPVAAAVGNHAGICKPGILVLETAVARAQVSVEVHVSPGTHKFHVELYHRVGSSMAGAAYTTLVRASPVRAAVEYDSQGPTNSDVVSAVPVLWLDAMVSNSGASTLYLMCFDSATVPGNGTLPMRQPVQVAAGGQTYIDLGVPGSDGISGRQTMAGLSWAASTTAITLTIDSTSSLWVTVRTLGV